jgi:hypothetical protein
MPIIQSIKDNPWKMLLGSSGTIITLVGALFTLDSRYAHAEAVEKDKTATQKTILQSSVTLRRQMLEDKLFELDVKKAQNPGQKLTPMDEAMKARYQRQLDELSKDNK